MYRQKKKAKRRARAKELEEIREAEEKKAQVHL
jgi:hypothetical protein